MKAKPKPEVIPHTPRHSTDHPAIDPYCTLHFLKTVTFMHWQNHHHTRNINLKLKDKVKDKECIPPYQYKQFDGNYASSPWVLPRLPNLPNFPFFVTPGLYFFLDVVVGGTAIPLGHVKFPSLFPLFPLYILISSSLFNW